MKSRILTVITTLSLFYLAGCSNGTNTSETTTTTTVDSTTTTKDTTATKKDNDEAVAFVTEAASGGMMEVEAGKLAVKNAMSDDVKKFGEKMVTDHSKANEELKALAASKNITIPMGLSDDDQKMVNELGTKTGKDFDKEYVHMMVKDHDKDVDKFEKAGKDLKDADLAAWANKTVPTLRTHKDLIHKIKENMK